jgi:hypothetical protein
VQCWTGRTGSTDHGGDNGPRSSHHKCAHDDRGGTNHHGTHDDDRTTPDHHGTSSHHGTHDDNRTTPDHHGTSSHHDRYNSPDNYSSRPDIRFHGHHESGGEGRSRRGDCL